jgi:hypothetical protein
MAGRFGCTTVNDAMAAEEVVPGVTPAVMRSVRAARLEADRRAREAQAHAIAAPQRRPQYYPQQPQVAAAATSLTAAHGAVLTSAAAAH